MAGFSKVFFIGSTGGFMGADGLARPFFQIMVGDADRQWLEPVYDPESQRSSDEGSLSAGTPVPRPIGDVRALVPIKPDDPIAILDAAIAFFPALFAACPTLPQVEAQLSGVTRLDFNIGRSVPSEWDRLRAEALPQFRELGVFEADLHPFNMSSLSSFQRALREILHFAENFRNGIAPNCCPGGGTGRRERIRISWLIRAGSSPAPGNLSNREDGRTRVAEW